MNPITGAPPPNSLECALIPGVVGVCHGVIKASGFSLADLATDPGTPAM